MTYLLEVLTFRRMIAPTLLQVLFWAAVGGCLYGSYVLVRLDSWAWPAPLILGTLVVRVIFEMGILAFRIYERLGEVLERLPRSE
jgi:hypothetical protein